MSRQTKRMLEELASAHGVDVEFATGGKHNVARFISGNRERKVFFSISPSDYRAEQNIRRDALRVFRQEGWTA